MTLWAVPKIRAWANKELGGGAITAFEADDYNYTLLNDEGKYWILLKGDKAKNQTCYFARGDDFLADEYNPPK